MSIVGLLAWLVTAPISPESLHNFAEPPPVRNCPQRPADGQQFTAPITIYLEIHGGMGEPYKCGETAFSLNFSKVNVVRDHRDLLKQMAISTVQGAPPIDLTVRGYFRAAPDQGRRELMVTHVYNWRTSHQPLLFLRRD